MNKFYIIIPILMMVVFGFIYKDFSAKYAIQMQEEEAALAAEEAAVAAQKAEAERKAKEDADRRTAEREAEEAAKLAKRLADWEAKGAEIAKATAEFNAEADKLSAEANELELQLRAIRNERDTKAGEAFDLTKKVEMARINKRTAELEIQRMTAMLSKRAEESSMTAMPELAPTSGR